MGLITFLSLSNDTTLLQIQSSGTVHLNEEDNIHILYLVTRQGNLVRDTWIRRIGWTGTNSTIFLHKGLHFLCSIVASDW
jgi:hypothetical protein